MKKRVLSVLLAAAMLSTLLAGCERTSESTSDSSSAAGGDVVKIGVFEPASGDNGAGGKQETLGIQYANYVTPTVEIGGKEYTVQLDIVDNESSNDKAPSAAATLVSDGVSVVLGAYGSAVSVLYEPADHRGKYPLLPYLFPGPVPGHGACQLCKR